MQLPEKEGFRDDVTERTKVGIVKGFFFPRQKHIADETVGSSVLNVTDAVYPVFRHISQQFFGIHFYLLIAW